MKFRFLTKVFGPHKNLDSYDVTSGMPQSLSLETQDSSEIAALSPQMSTGNRPRGPDHHPNIPSKRKAIVVSSVITGVVLLIMGVALLAITRQRYDKYDKTNKVVTSDVTLSSESILGVPKELQGAKESLVVQGDLITRGALKISNNSNVLVVQSDNLTDDRTIILPDQSGTLCIDTNNCNYATEAQLAQLQQSINQIIQTTVPPVTPRTITPGSTKLSVINGDGIAGNPTIDVVEANIALNNLGGNLDATKGGTGVGTVAIGDLLYGSASNTWNKIPIGVANQCLIVSGGLPSWGPCSAASNFTAAGTGGVDQTINFGDTLTLAQGSNITTTGGATDTVTIATVANPSFSTSVTTPLLQNAGALSITTTATAGADDIIFSTASAEVIRIMENGDLKFEKGANDVTFAVTAPGVAATYTFSGATGTVLTGANYSGTLDPVYVNVGESPAAGDITGSFTAGLTIGVDSVALTTDTTGNYVATGASGNGVDLTGGGSEGATLTAALGVLTANWNQTGAFDIVLNNAGSELSILESAGATFYGNIDVGDLTANRTYTFPDATGDVCLNSGNCVGGGGGGAPNSAAYVTVGNDATLSAERAIAVGTNLSAVDGGANGSYTISTVNNPSFSTSVTTPLLQNAGALSITTTATAGADDIIFSTASAEVIRIMENGDLKFEKGANDVTFAVTAPGAAATYTFSGATGTVLTGANYSGTLDPVYVNVGESPAAGDITGSFTAGLTIGVDSVALTTDTTGNYVATGASGNGVALTGGGSEGATLTAALGALTADWNQTGAFDIVLNNASSELSILESAGATFYGNIDVGDLTANRTYTFPDATGSVCLSTGNCAGSGSGVTTSGGSVNTLAKFSAAQNIENSTITDDGANVTTSVDLIIQGGDVNIGTTTQLGSLVLHDGSSNTGTIRIAPHAANRVYTVPDAGVDDTVCLFTLANCSGSGSGATLQAAYVAGNTIDVTTGEGPLAFTLTSADFTINTITNGTNFTTFSRADGAGTNSPAQLLLVDNLDVNLAQPIGIKIQSAAGAITTAIDVSDTEITTALAIGSNDITTTATTISSTELDRLDGKDAALVDTNDAVATAITGTGILTSGTWQASTIAVLYGGTGATTSQGAINNLSQLTTEGDLLYRDATNSTRLARGTNGQCLTSNATTVLWASCDAAGAITSLTLAGTSGTNQTITNGDTITIAAGTNITTTGGATDTVTVATVNNPVFSTSVTTPSVTNTAGLTLNATSAALTLQTTTSGNVVLDSAGGTIELQDATNVTGNFTATGTGLFSGASVTIGAAALQGSLILNDGNGGQIATIQVGNIAASTVLTIPSTLGVTDTFCFFTLANCSGSATTLQASYTADVDGSDAVIALTTADGGVIIRDNATPIGSTLFAVQTSGSTNFLNVAASGINLGVSTTVAANQTINLTGGNTASRPGTPTEGMVYFDTTTKQLLTYSNGKWQADRTTATKIVAASNSSQALKDAADYVADGTGDQTEINSAITAVNATGGGVVYLLEGTYTINATISMLSNVQLIGSGYSTIITIPNAFNSSIDLISESTNPVNIVIRDLTLDGNRSNQTASGMDGIELTSMDGGTGTTANRAVLIENLVVQNFYGGSGIDLTTVNNATINNNIIRNVANYGIYSSGSRVIISNNQVYGSNTGIWEFNGSDTSIIGNVVQGNTYGIALNGTDVTVSGNTSMANSIGIDVSADDVAITGNTVSENTSEGIRLISCSQVTVSGNTIDANSYGVELNSCNYGSITGNIITNNTATGVNVEGGSTYWVVSGNNISTNASYGVQLNGVANSLVSNNYIYDNGGTAGYSGIHLTDADYSQIIGNRISDTAGTGYAINILSTTTSAYLADNTYSGTGASSINDVGIGTIYGGQLDSSGNFNIRTQAGIGLNTTAPAYSLQNTGAFVQGAMTTPAAAGVTVVGTTGATTWGYRVTAYDGLGETLASTETTIANGNATLTGANFNRIVPARVNGAISYKIYRTTAGGTPSSTGLIGTLAGGAATFQFDDTGIAGGAAIPTVNATGQLQALGSAVLFKNSTDSTTAFQIQNLAGTSNLFVADTTNTRIGIGDATPASLFTVGNGDLFQVSSAGNVTFNQTTPTITIGNTGSLVFNDGTNTLCTIADAGTTGNLTCTGNITGASAGTVGYWTRSGTTLSQATANDILSIASNATTTPILTVTSSGAVTSGNAAALDLQVTSASTSVPGINLNYAGSGLALRVNDDGTNSDSTPFVVDATGNVGIGTTAPTAKLQVSADATADLLNLYMAGASSGDDANINLYRSRGTIASPATNVSGDTLGSIVVRGYGTAAYHRAAQIIFGVDGTPGSGDMPGNIQFYTTPDGLATPQERLRIINNGNVGIGTTAPTAKLDIDSSNTTTNAVQTTANSQTTGNILDLNNSTSAFSGNVIDANIASNQSDRVEQNVATVYTNNTTEANTAAGTAFNLLNTGVQAADDGTYFMDSTTFNTLNIDIATAGVAVTNAVEYCSVNAVTTTACDTWTAVSGLSDGTTNYTVDGKITWTDPGASWITSVETAGNSGKWLRIRSTTSPTTAPTANYATISIFTGNFLSVANAGSTKLVVTADGNVGIDTSAPGARLHIAENDTGDELVVGEDLWNLNDTNNRIFLGNSNASSYFRLGQSASAFGYMGWNYNATEASAYQDLSTIGTDNLVLQNPGANGSGRVGVGITSPQGKFHISNNGTVINTALIQWPDPNLLISGSSGAGVEAQIELVHANNSANNNSFIQGVRARGSLGTPTAVVNGDDLFDIHTKGYDGSALQIGAAIRFQVDNTVSAGNVPTAIQFDTGTNGTNRVTVQTLSSTGQATFKNRTDSTTAFQVQNSAGTTTILDVDTTNGRVGIGDTSPLYALTVGNGDLFGIDGAANTSLVWEGSTADANQTTLTVVNPTADIIYRLADAAAGTYDVCTTAANCVGLAGANLQQAYGNDTDGSDAIIALTTADDSVIIRNPATFGTDSAFVFQTDNLATGSAVANFKNLNVTSTGSFDTTAASLTNYGGYFSNTSTESAGANVLTNIGLYATASGADNNYAAIFESGNVGIGTNAPAGILHVSKNQDAKTLAIISNTDAGTTAHASFELQNDGTNGRLELATFGTGWTSSGMYKQDAGLLQAHSNLSNGLSIGTSNATASMRFYTGGSADSNERLRILSNGNVGIGATAPNALLDVEPTGAVTTTSYAQKITNLQTNVTTDAIDKYGLFVSSTGAFTGVGGTSTNNYGLYVDTPTGGDNNYAAVFQGNVGIGTTTPTDPLHVKVDQNSSGRIVLENLNAGTAATAVFSARNAASANASATFGVTGTGFTNNGVQLQDAGYININSSLSNGFSISTESASDIRFATNGTTNERLRITSTGNVGIGTTGPDRRLDVLDATNPQLRLTHTDDTVYVDLRATNNGGLRIISSDLATDNSFGLQGRFTVAGTGTSLNYYGSELDITNNQTVNPNTLYGQYIHFTDAGTLANTVTGLYVDATTANANDTTYVAIFQGGNVGIGDTSPAQLLSVGNGDLFNVTSAGHVLANSASTATTGTTEATARTNVTSITLTTDAFNVNDVIFFNNAVGQDYYTRVTIDNANGTYTVSPAVSYDATITVTKYTIQNIGATATDYTTQANRYFQGYFLGGVVTGAGSTIYSDGVIQTGTTGLAIKNTSDSTAAFQVQNAVATNILTVDSTNSQTLLRGINSTATLGAEKVTNGTFTGNATGWTLGTGWAYGTNNVTKTAGTASDLEQNITAVSGETYQVIFTISARTAGCLTPQVGGVSGVAICANSTAQTQVVTATGTGNLKLMADSTFDGTVDDVSVKRITNSNSILAVQNSDASTALEVRSGGIGLNNTFIGLNAGRSTTTGTNNVALGTYALQSNTTGTNNIALGREALYNTTTGVNNIAIGYQTLYSNTTGVNNTAIGHQSLFSNTTGSYNIAIGWNALFDNTTGVNNTAIGYQAGWNNTTGDNNTAVGHNAFNANTTGTGNTVLGHQALGQNTTGSWNVALGADALFSNIDGVNNTATGLEALRLNTTGDNNTATGIGALYNTTSNGNTGTGYRALRSNTTGFNNTALGYNAGYQDPTISAFVTLGNLNNATAIGYGAQVQSSSSLVLGGQDANAVNVGIGTTMPDNLLSVSPVSYSTGTASQSTTTVTGVGTTWTSSMVGKKIIFASGESAIITAFGSATSLTVDTSQTVATTNYRIHEWGLQVTSSGNVGIGSDPGSTRLVVGADSTVDEKITIQSHGRSSLAIYGDNESNGAGTAVIQLCQDGATNCSIFGTIQTAGQDPYGAAYTGTLANATLLSSYISNNALQLGTGSNVSVTIDTARNVGIGDTTPDAQLDIDSTATTGNIFRIDSSTITTGDFLNIQNLSAVSTGSDMFFGLHQATYTTTQTNSGSLLELNRNLTTNTGGALTNSGAVGKIFSNCTVTAGTCTDTAKILDLEQFYASASGEVLHIKGIGTGSLLKVTDTTGTDLDVFNIADEGAATFQNKTDSTAAFTVQKTGSGVELFQIDSTNSRVQIGDTTADDTGVILVLDTKTGATEPTGVNGAMYYNSSTNTFRCYENSAWTDCLARHKITLGSDVADSTGACTWGDITGLSFSVTSGVNYRFFANIAYTSNVTGNGAGFAATGPTNTLFSYKQHSILSGGITGYNGGGTGADQGGCSASSASNATTGNTATLDGFILPTANGTLQLRFAAEASGDTTTVKAGSTLEWW